MNFSLFNNNNPNYNNDIYSFINCLILINGHNHPLKLCYPLERKNYGNGWTCNKCFCNFTYEYPSFYCTFCDFDLCKKCIGEYRLNEINIYENNFNNFSFIQVDPNNKLQWQKYSPFHNHFLTYIQRNNNYFSWICNNCKKVFQNKDCSFYCSLCDFDLCIDCLNKNNNNNINNDKNILNIPSIFNPFSNNNNNYNNMNFELIKSDKIYDCVRKIKEISENRILILYWEFFEIFDLKTSNKICRIEEKIESNFPRYDNLYYGFIELMNKDLILWSRGKIFYYKKFDNNYKLSQTINELEQQQNRSEMRQAGNIQIYDLNNIFELDNNTLISCNSIGLKLYNIVQNEIKFVKAIPMFLDVENIILINTNIFLVIHHNISTTFAFESYTSHKIALSLFDLKSYQINMIFNQQTNIDWISNSLDVFNYFLVKDTFLYQISDFTFKNEYINKELELNYNIFNIKTNENNFNLKTCFRLMSYYKDDLFFAQNYSNLFICFLNNNTFTSIYKFDFNFSDVTVLRNNDLIFYGGKIIKIINNNNGGKDGYDYKSNIYEHYKFLPQKMM